LVGKSNNDVNVGRIEKKAAIICGGNVGGRQNIEQAGGKDANKVNKAIERVKELV